MVTRLGDAMGAEVCAHRAGDKHLAPRGEARWWDLGGRRGDHASEARRQQHMYWTTASRTSPRRTVNERWTRYGAAGQSSRGNVARRQPVTSVHICIRSDPQQTAPPLSLESARTRFVHYSGSGELPSPCSK